MWIQLFNFTIKYVSGNRHIAMNNLSHHSKVEEEDENKENINNFINSQLNYVRISVSELEEQKDGILEPGYSLEY